MKTHTIDVNISLSWDFFCKIICVDNKTKNIIKNVFEIIFVIIKSLPITKIEIIDIITPNIPKALITMDKKSYIIIFKYYYFYRGTYKRPIGFVYGASFN